MKLFPIANHATNTYLLALLLIGGSCPLAKARAKTPPTTPVAVVRMASPAAPIPMVPYDDRWNLAVERWWDIGSHGHGGHDYYNQFNDWITAGRPNGKFDYATRAKGVTLVYDKTPAAPYFIGHISAHGLKPNFAYQMKLAGKPTQGPRGMGLATSYVTVTSRLKSGIPLIHTKYDAAGHATDVNGDDWTNQQLGYAGRWWDESNPSSNTNAIIDEDYQINTRDTVCGYLFIGDFVTDAGGNAEWDVRGDHSYHITWQNWQKDAKQVRLGTFTITGARDAQNPNRYYAYGPVAPASRHPQENGAGKVTLYYELEWNRINPVRLTPGTYHCRLLLTEETFHNAYFGNTTSTLGGRWKTVMATEAFTGDQPDTNPANDIVFTIR